jgi:hypothetical protein
MDRRSDQDRKMSEAREVAVGTSIDWRAQMVTFQEQAVNGIVTINAPTITVPLIRLMRIAAEAMLQSMPPQIRAMQFPAPVIEPPENTRGGRSLAFDANLGPH